MIKDRGAKIDVCVKVVSRIGAVDTPFTQEVMPRFHTKNMTKLKV